MPCPRTGGARPSERREGRSSIPQLPGTARLALHASGAQSRGATWLAATGSAAPTARVQAGLMKQPGVQRRRGVRSVTPGVPLRGAGSGESGQSAVTTRSSRRRRIRSLTCGIADQSGKAGDGKRTRVQLGKLRRTSPRACADVKKPLLTGLICSGGVRERAQSCPLIGHVAGTPTLCDAEVGRGASDRAGQRVCIADAHRRRGEERPYARSTHDADAPAATRAVRRSTTAAMKPVQAAPIHHGGRHGRASRLERGRDTVGTAGGPRCCRG